MLHASMVNLFSLHFCLKRSKHILKVHLMKCVQLQTLWIMIIILHKGKSNPANRQTPVFCIVPCKVRYQQPADNVYSMLLLSFFNVSSIHFIPYSIPCSIPYSVPYIFHSIPHSTFYSFPGASELYIDCCMWSHLACCWFRGGVHGVHMHPPPPLNPPLFNIMCSTSMRSDQCQNECGYSLI